MPAIAQGKFTHPDILSDIKKIWPASFESLLPIVLRQTEANTFVGYLKSGPADHFLEVDELAKIRHEISRWESAIGFSSAELKSLSPALYELQEAGDERTLTRTLRILKVLEVLFFAANGKTTAGWASLEKLVKRLLADPKSALPEALQVVGRTYIKLHPQHKYYTSLALLLVVAAAESQCEAFRPVFWEARSAARARDELKRRWSGLQGNVLEVILDIVTLLIRYQSAPGQYARKTGDERFRRAVKEVAQAHRSKSIITEKELLAALTVIGVLEEARNHQLPLDQANYKIGNLEINAGLTWKWRQTGVKKIPRLIKETGKGAKHTWGYASRLRIEKKELEAFKTFVEKNLQSLTGGNQLDWTGKEVAEYTFDRTQIEDLRVLIAEYVKKVISDRNRVAAFNRNFEIRVLLTPNCFGKEEPEHVVEVLLNDYIAAERLLFKQGEIGHSPEKLLPFGKTAGDLLVYLFERAKEFFQLESGLLHDRQKFYLPFPLMRRMLDIVYRLCPESCMSVPITFNDGVQRAAHIPMGLLQNAHREIIVCIANYVPALVLNQAMSEGLQSCDIGLDSLVASSTSATTSSAAAVNDKPMEAQDWKREIEEAFRLNAYDLLVEKYLRDYNTEREYVQWLRASRSSTLLPISINELLGQITDYVNNAVDKKTARHFFLGIDIGGTLTKFQFYEFIAGAETFMPVGKSFRMLTVERSVQDQNPAERFALRLIDTIKANIKGDEELRDCIVKNQVCAVGISWPGPVRNNRVAGTSSILKQFPPLTNKIKENRIEEVMRLDIAGALKEAWKKREVWRNLVEAPVPRHGMESLQEPFVAIVNDGSADGMGVVADWVWREKAAVAGRLAIVKLGTGTAGAVFKDGRLDASLTEWGKMLLDLAAHPKLLDPKSNPVGFPEGTTNHYLSSKTMPALAKKFEGGLFNLQDLDSLELGILLEAGVRKFDLTSLRRLRNECGIREYANRGMGEPIDVEVLRRVCERGDEAEPALFELIELQVNKLGREALQSLNEKIDLFGSIRLTKLLEVRGDHIRAAFNSKKPTPKIVIKKLRRAYEASIKCAQALGNYLGDFIVLLYGIYKMPVVIVGGGVLGGKTGEWVVRQALKRTQSYGLEFADRGDGVLQLDAKKKLGTGANKAKPDFGTLGAAVFAASEFLFDLKQSGIDTLKAHLMKLTINQSVEVYENEVVFKDSPQDNIVLAQYALTKKDVTEYLTAYGPDLNFYSSSAAGDEPLVFIQWVKE